MTVDPNNLRNYKIFTLFVPPLMLVSAFLFFIPRNPDFYQQENGLNLINMVFVGVIWCGLAYLSFYIVLFLSQREQMKEISIKKTNLNNENRKILQGFPAYFLFIVIASFIFGYFEVQYQGFALLHPSELLLYPISLVPFFTLAYFGRYYLKEWKYYIIIWIIWAIIWDTAVPGFVYVPNLYTWHQWMFAPVCARFVIDGYLSYPKNEMNLKPE
jgi:hypothetical protein